MKMESRKEQIEGNYAAFKNRLSDLMKTHAGKFALMHDGEIIDFFDTPLDAAIAGDRLYGDGLFSVQEVDDTPVDLGIFSHANP